MKKLYFFQANNLNYLFPQPAYWLPYSVACLWSYVREFSEVTDNFQCMEMGFKKEMVDKVSDRMASNPPDVVALSFYVWNTKYNIKLAEQIHKDYPDCKIIIGGPQVNERYLEYDWCNHVIMGEGEENFLEFLRDDLKGNTKKIYEQKRVKNLDIPSPYPVLDEFCVDRFPDYRWYSTFETNRGCPYQCTFCDWGTTTASKIYQITMERIESEIEWFRTRPIVVIYGADANWGILKRDVEIAKMLREVADDNPYIRSIALQYAKNSNRTVFEVAKELGHYTSVTCSLQSTNPKTCEIIKRKNMKIDNLKEMMELSVEFNVPTYTEMILGLPEETLDSYKDGLNEVLECGQHQQTNNNLLFLLENSELASWDSRLEHGYKTHFNVEGAHDWATGGAITIQDKIDHDIDPEVTESLELVQSTNTMSNDDITEAFLYYYMMYNFHSVGFTRYLSKWARAKGLSYRDFYDKLWQLINQNENFIPIKDSIIHDLRKYTGIIDSPEAVNIFVLRDRLTDYLCKDIQVTWDLIKKVCHELDVYDQNVWDFQLSVMGFLNKSIHTLPYNASHPLPADVELGTYKFEVNYEAHQSRGAGMDLKNNVPKLVEIVQL